MSNPCLDSQLNNQAINELAQEVTPLVLDNLKEQGFVVTGNVQMYSTLPPANTSTNLMYNVLSGEGTPGLPVWAGGSYYPRGFYISNGITWHYIIDIVYAKAVLDKRPTPPLNGTEGDIYYDSSKKSLGQLLENGTWIYYAPDDLPEGSIPLSKLAVNPLNRANHTGIDKQIPNYAIPVGGNMGEILVKNSNINYDLSWSNVLSTKQDKIFVSASAPPSPYEGQLWLDIS
jgi:hypothetical protein